MRLDPQHAGHDRLTLAGALRDLRQAAGLSGERLARRCHMSQSKVSRIETGRLLPTMIDVDRILTAVGADESIRADLLALARLAGTEYHDIRASLRRGLHHRQRELAALEAGTKEIRHFLPALITGLLQTPEYMRAAMNTPTDPATTDTAAALALKLERQAVLYDKTKRFEFLLTESAVRWQLCEPALMALQLDRLVSLSWLANVRLGVLSLTAPRSAPARSIPSSATTTTWSPSSCSPASWSCATPKTSTTTTPCSPSSAATLCGGTPRAASWPRSPTATARPVNASTRITLGTSPGTVLTCRDMTTPATRRPRHG